MKKFFSTNWKFNLNLSSIEILLLSASKKIERTIYDFFKKSKKLPWINNHINM